MYIKLGNIVVNRLNSINDFMIFVEVVDSTMSFEKPVYVRTPEELDIWFGRNFSSRDYFLELLDYGVTLYLYKPVSTERYISDNEYIDVDALGEYEEEVIYYTLYALPKVGDENIKYNVDGEYYVYLKDLESPWIKLSDLGKYVDRPSQDFKKYLLPRQFANIEDLPEVGDSTKKYKVLDLDKWFLWVDDSWVSEDSLPQNMENLSISLNNRDTLALTTPEIDNLPKFFYPEYHNDLGGNLGLFSEDVLGVDTKFTEIDGVLYYNDLVEKIYLKKEDLPKVGDPNIKYRVLDKYFVFNTILGEWEPYTIGNYDLLKERLEVSISSENILSGLETLAFHEEFSGSGNDQLSLGFQLIHNVNPERSGDTMVYNSNVKNEIIYNGAAVDSKLYQYKTPVTNLAAIKTALSDTGYNVLERSKNDILAYSDKSIELCYLNQFNNLKIINDFTYTNKILTKMFSEYINLEMWSKTIGRDSNEYEESANITVLIEEIGYQYYRFTISRYEYSEVFEGYLFNTPGLSRIDDLISRRSKLVYCRIKNDTVALRTGTFKLLGAQIEELSKPMYWESLNMIVQEEIYPDYILVPDINKYVSGLDKNYNYYKEYEEFLKIAKNLNCQVLIQNSKSPYELIKVQNLPKSLEKNKIYLVDDKYYSGETGKLIDDNYIISLATTGNDYIFNYREDKENRLVYFYGDMTYNLYSRPGYYIFLNGLLTNIFSDTSQTIIYKSPVTSPYDLPYAVTYVNELPRQLKPNTVYIIGDQYYLNGKTPVTDQSLKKSIEDEVIKNKLSEYKSNYLVYNNQMYYYRGYENGIDYETTLWMRFAISKVYRELQKNKWIYLGLTNIGKIRENIKNVLYRIPRAFSLIGSVEIASFIPKLKENSLQLTLNIKVKDLVENNIVIDIIINYNNNN